LIFKSRRFESDPELATRLEYSPILGDVRELSSVYDARENKRTRKFTLNVRYDTDKERAEAQAAAEKGGNRRRPQQPRQPQMRWQRTARGEEETAVAPATGGDEAEHG